MTPRPPPYRKPTPEVCEETDRLMAQIEPLIIGASNSAFSIVVCELLVWMLDEVEGDDEADKQQRQEELLARLVNLVRFKLADKPKAQN